MNVLITTGPTREPIDAVRYISNRSSGRVGLAIAIAAVEAGDKVTLLAGQGIDVSAAPGECEVVRFEAAADLEAKLAERFPECDVLIMAAAVADYRPARATAGKIERDSTKPMSLDLEPVPDLVAALAARKRAGQRIVAFALEEPAKLLDRARQKLIRKGVDALVANPLATMDASDIAPTWLTAGGGCETPGTMSKAVFGQWLVARIHRDFPPVSGPWS